MLMSVCLHVEKPLRDRLATLASTVIDQRDVSGPMPSGLLRRDIPLVFPSPQANLSFLPHRVDFHGSFCSCRS